MLTKKEKHEKAEEFRRQIVLPMQRNAVISGFINKESFDDSDRFKLMILFKKMSYLQGCEEGYRKLIAKINASGDAFLQEKAKKATLKLGNYGKA